MAWEAGEDILRTVRVFVHGQRECVREGVWVIERKAGRVGGMNVRENAKKKNA